MQQSSLVITPHLPAVAVEPAAPWHDQEPQPATFQCAICSKTGYERFEGSEEFEDENGATLKEAQYAPNSWVCSRACRSQLMFQSGCEIEQYALQNLEKALLDIYEYLPGAQSIMEAHLGYSVDLDKLKASVDAVRKEIAVTDDPAWIQANGEVCGATTFVARIGVAK